MNEDDLAQIDQAELMTQFAVQAFSARRDVERKLRQPCLEEIFNKTQIQELVEHVQTLELYQKYVSIQIKHQIDSIKTLKVDVTKMFPELLQRQKLLIEKAVANFSFIKQMTLPYSSIVKSTLSERKALEFIQKNQQQHSHSHSHFDHEKCKNLFFQVASQWSKDPDLNHMKKILAYVEQHWGKMVQSSQKGQQSQMKVLVVDCGMGRLLYQLKKILSKKQVNGILQGHQTNAQNYICAQHFLNRNQKQYSIYPYIHNFSNFLKSNSPYRQVVVPEVSIENSYFYPITWGSFQSLYKTHQNGWNCIITVYHNYNMTDILFFIKLMYSILREGGIWIDICTANFGKNVVPMSYREYENVLDKSQFKLLAKQKAENIWFGDKECIMNEKRTTFYRVMQK